MSRFFPLPVLSVAAMAAKYNEAGAYLNLIVAVLTQGHMKTWIYSKNGLYWHNKINCPMVCGLLIFLYQDINFTG